MKQNTASLNESEKRLEGVLVSPCERLRESLTRTLGNEICKSIFQEFCEIEGL